MCEQCDFEGEDEDFAEPLHWTDAAMIGLVFIHGVVDAVQQAVSVAGLAIDSHARYQTRRRTVHEEMVRDIEAITGQPRG